MNNMTRNAYLLISLLCCLLTTTPVLADTTRSHTRLIALDINEGQAILLQHKNRGLLIDTGHAGEAINLLKKLNHYGVTELDAVIFTHLHPDHASAYFRIKEAFPAGRFYSNCQPIQIGKAPDISRWVAESLQSNPAHQCLAAADSLSFADVKMDILWPDKIEGNNLNYNSLVIHIIMKQRNILLMGDANKVAEKKLLDAGRLPNSVDTLIVGHHGWHDASSEALIKQLKPSQAIISINANNARGYPHGSVLQRLQQYGASISRTDQHGDILLE
jgi:competence protein ComEC